MDPVNLDPKSKSVIDYLEVQFDWYNYKYAVLAIDYSILYYSLFFYNLSAIDLENRLYTVHCILFPYLCMQCF